MTKSKYLPLTAIVAVLSTGCGGGSDGGATGGAQPSVPSPTPVTAPSAPTSEAVINPLTGAAAPGSATKTLTGFAYAGATVMAFNVNADGSSGPVIAGPTSSTANGFTLNFAAAPTSWVRLVATGGTKERDLDYSQQPGGTMQLVTPFITTSHNNLKITPITDIAANVMASNAKKGMPLADAFSAGMRSMLQLDGANAFLKQDKSVYLNVLRGSIKSDTVFSEAQSLDSRELLHGLEFLGVVLDMPTKEITRVVGASAQSNYSLSGVDGLGTTINAGAWTVDAFDPAAPNTLSMLMNTKALASQKFTDLATGTKVAPRLVEYISRYMIMDVVMDTACRSGASLYFTARYPYYAVDGQGRMHAADCTAAAARIAELRSRVETNRSTGTK